MKNLTKPVLAMATIAALASGLALAQGGVANAADPTATPTATPTASDCAVAVSLPEGPIAPTGAVTEVTVTTTWTGACLTELNKDATATFGFVSTPSTDANAIGTPILTQYPVVSRSLTQGTGTTVYNVPTSGLSAAGTFVALKLASSTTTKADATATVPTFATAVKETSNQVAIKSGSIADTKYTRDGKSVIIVGHAYSYIAGAKTAQSAASVQLQKLVVTPATTTTPAASTYQTVATTTTSATGRYQFSIVDTAGSTYRVATTETTTVESNTSPSIAVSLFTQADTKVIRLSTSKVAKKATIKGTLFVRSSVTGNFKATSGVAANLEKKVNGVWVKVKKVRSTTAGSISAVANNVKKTSYRFVVIQNTSYKTSTSSSIAR